MQGWCAVQPEQGEEIKKVLVQSAFDGHLIVLGKTVHHNGKKSEVDNFLLAAFLALQGLTKPFTSHQAIAHLRTRLLWDHPSTTSIWQKLSRYGWVGPTGSKSKGKSLWQTREIDCTPYLQEAERLLLKGESGVR
ncbi:MAG: hypothetical protein A2Z11_01465 [Candidatus Woykebacteria bacterium RBG_16_43_9]|uniref:Uncharacterized protein n=1 Tax=Candidatus Woykebacteria bacterium RBG_16_43_9 TaxID=1802596 RepID=A0A1G1WGR9_9BACT|nr:MAG: hypothetical protein A2Z11_01465 [Candidatus Woykebacteria bacterium RBG_16_43_9]